MRKVALVALVVVGLAAGCVAALYAYVNAEFTACYGIFPSRQAAERAADAARARGLDPEVDHRQTDSAVTFTTGETGNDARKARQAFREIVRRQGRLGHPDGGCLERTFFN